MLNVDLRVKPIVAAFTGSPAQHATELMAHLHNNFNIDRQNVGMTMPKGVNVEECVILYSGVNFFFSIGSTHVKTQ